MWQPPSYNYGQECSLVLTEQPSVLLLSHRPVLSGVSYHCSIEGVWHTGVVLDGELELFYGAGIQRARAGATPFGSPHRVIDLGSTDVSGQLLDELLADLAPRYRPADYSLLFHNCNTFSNELAQLLTGEGLPVRQ